MQGARRKFPPITRESTGVYTLCIHPPGMKRVSPLRTLMRLHSPAYYYYYTFIDSFNIPYKMQPGKTVSGKKTLSCSRDVIQSLYARRLIELGGMKKKSFWPWTTWYLKDVIANPIDIALTKQMCHQNRHESRCRSPAYHRERTFAQKDNLLLSHDDQLASNDLSSRAVSQHEVQEYAMQDVFLNNVINY